MPVMPAPTTSTSTSTRSSSRGEGGVSSILYRPVSIFSDRGALRNGAPGPGPEGALLRPRLLPTGGRAALAPGLADGVPAGGDPVARRLRDLRLRRPVRGRRAGRRRGRAGVPERLPAPGGPAGRGSGHGRDRVHLPVPRLVLRRRRPQ